MIDNVVTSCFQTQKMLSPEQAKYLDFLTKFDYMLDYKLGKVNVFIDVLSRKVEFITISKTRSSLLERTKEGLINDILATSLVALVIERKARKIWVIDGLL